MDTYHYVLYVHLLAVFIGVGAASVLMVCLFQLKAAKTLADAVPWGAVAGNSQKFCTPATGGARRELLMQLRYEANSALQTLCTWPTSLTKDARFLSRR